MKRPSMVKVGNILLGIAVVMLFVLGVTRGVEKGPIPDIICIVVVIVGFWLRVTGKRKSKE